MLQIFGPESTGKTSLALSAVAQAQRRNGHCAFIDLEHALSQDFAQASSRLFHSQLPHGRTPSQLLLVLLRAGLLTLLQSSDLSISEV